MRYLIVLLLSGCATDWYGGTPQQFRRESAQCRQAANSISGAGLIQRDAVFEDCMIGKGWEPRRRLGVF